MFEEVNVHQDLKLELILAVSNVVGKYCQRVYRTVQVGVIVVVAVVVVVGEYYLLLTSYKTLYKFK